MFGLGVPEMLIVGVVAVLLFGSRLPQVARSAGKSLTEFKRGMQDLQDEVRTTIEAEDHAASQPRRLESKAATVVEDDEEITVGYPEPESPLDEPLEAEASAPKPADA